MEMNLKEAFRFQNRLGAFMDEAQAILGCDQNVTKVQNTYLRKKVMAEAENETTFELPSTEYGEQITQIAEFLLYLLDQRETLAGAIRKAKDTLPIDMDSEVSLNGKRQDLSRLFQYMANLRSSEVLLSGGGTGYRFNAEGNQVSYRCDVKRVATINFDRKKIRRFCIDLNQTADAMSAQLDLCLINSQVSYEPPFDVNDSFAEVFESFAGNQSES
jgi:hypothetical protein